MDAQYSEHPAMFRNHPLGFILAILLIAAAGIGIIILLVWYLRCKSTRLELQGNNLVLEEGLLSKERTELKLSAIRSVKVYQSFFNRLFGVGRITIYSAGDEAEFEADGMPHPHELRDLIKTNQAD